MIALLSFSRSLASKGNVFNFTTYISLNNQPSMPRPTIIDSNPDEHNKRLHYYPFMIDLDRFNENCNLN